MKNVEVKPAGEKHTSTLRVAGPAEKQVQAMVSKTSASGKPTAKAVSFFEKGDSKPSEPKEPKENISNAVASKPKSVAPPAASFFGAAKATAAAPKVDAPVAEETARKPEAAAAKLDLEEFTVNSDDEWDDGFKVDKAKLEKRGKAFGAPEGEGGMHQPEISMDSDAEGEAALEPQVKRSYARGAMDDFVDESAPATECARQKKRKLVPKVSAVVLLDWTG